MARVRSAEQRAVRLARQYLGKHGIVAVYTQRDPGSMEDVIIIETLDGRRPPGLPMSAGRTGIRVR